MIKELKAWGCDTEDALNRVLDDEAFYRECLLDVPGDPCFEQLGTALRAHDVPAAFDAAHALKGVLANLGLTPMLHTTVEIVEPLRAGSDAGLLPKYEQLMRQRDKLSQLLG